MLDFPGCSDSALRDAGGVSPCCFVWCAEDRNKVFWGSERVPVVFGEAFQGCQQLGAKLLLWPLVFTLSEG